MAEGAQVDENKKDWCAFTEWKKQRVRKESEREKVSETLDWGG